MRLTVLGCGTSSGVPRIGNDWGECDPTNPKNRRRRVSVLVEHGPTTILVDTGPDMREQLLAANVDHVDAVFFTHDHADHTHGIDDLRGLTHHGKRRVPCFGDAATLAMLTSRFDYIFAGTGGYPAIGSAHPIEAAHVFGDVTVRPFRQIHGLIDSVGYRFEAGGAAFAYSTDWNAIPDADAMLAGLDLWVVDALRRRPHPSHPHLGMALEWIARLRPRRAVLTHMDTSMDYATLAAMLPPGVQPGYDGLVVEA